MGRERQEFEAGRENSEGTSKDGSRSTLEMSPVDKVVYGKKNLVPDCNTLAIARVIIQSFHFQSLSFHFH